MASEIRALYGISCMFGALPLDDSDRLLHLVTEGEKRGSNPLPVFRKDYNLILLECLVRLRKHDNDMIHPKSKMAINYYSI